MKGCDFKHIVVWFVDGSSLEGTLMHFKDGNFEILVDGKIKIFNMNSKEVKRFDLD